MALAVVTVASGGLPVVDVTATAPKLGLPVDEATRGIAVTKVAAGKPGLAVIWATGGASAAVVFDPATLTNVTLSNGGLTATHTNATDNSGARVASAKSTGKYYFEMTISSGPLSFDMVGMLTSAGTYTNLVNDATNSVSVGLNNGFIYANNAYTNKNVAAVVVSNVLGFAIDLTTRKAWVRKGAGLWNNTAGEDPATAVGGVTVGAGSFAPAVGFSTGGAGTAVTANFGATAFANAAPSGFINWPTS
jgi:hypothetical protein